MVIGAAAACLSPLRCSNGRMEGVPSNDARGMRCRERTSKATPGNDNGRWRQRMSRPQWERASQTEPPSTEAGPDDCLSPLRHSNGRMGGFLQMTPEECVAERGLRKLRQETTTADGVGECHVHNGIRLRKQNLRVPKPVLTIV